MEKLIITERLVTLCEASMYGVLADTSWVFAIWGLLWLVLGYLLGKK